MTDDTERTRCPRWPDCVCDSLATCECPQNMTDDTERVVAILHDRAGEFRHVRENSPTAALLDEAAALLTKEREARANAEKGWREMGEDAAKQAARAESAEAEAKRLREALAELVAVKDAKERAEAIVAAEECNIAFNTRFVEWQKLMLGYALRRKLAWESARTALAKREGGEG